jgi:hypothetical protein
MSMRYIGLFTIILAAAGCEVTVQGGTGSQTPNNASPQPVANNPAPTPATTTNPTPAPVDTTPGIHAPRAIGGGATTTAPNPNLSPTQGARLPAMKGDNGFGSGTQTPDSFAGNIYFIPPATQKLPDFASLQPTGVLYSRQFNVPPQNFDKGFPGVDSRFEWFAIRWTGNFTVATPGAYNFNVLSDDGANVYVDGQKVLDNDGQHAPKNARSTVNLTAGQHTFQLDYFQGPRYQVALQLWVTPPGGTEKLFTSAL